MVCEKCGAQIDDTILSVYCNSCGHKLPKNSVTVDKDDFEELKSGKNRKRKKWYLAAAIAGGILLAAVIAILVIIQGPEAFRNLNQTAAKEHKVKKYKENTEEISITDQSIAQLEGIYQELTRIDSNGDVRMSGEFPELQFLACSKVLECDIEDFSAEKFPALEEVHLQVENAEVDEDFWTTLAGFQAMYDRGEIRSFTYQVSHTIEDLYGEWADEKGLLSLTIMEDGNIRVGAGSGLLGAELLTFTEVDNNTLNLKVNAVGVIELVSLQMDYDLMGDQMRVSIFGNTYLLKRK